jgi:hypothetical protein
LPAYLYVVTVVATLHELGEFMFFAIGRVGRLQLPTDTSFTVPGSFSVSIATQWSDVRMASVFHCVMLPLLSVHTWKKLPALTSVFAGVSVRLPSVKTNDWGVKMKPLRLEARGCATVKEAVTWH